MVSTLLLISCMPTISLASACGMSMSESPMAMQSMPLSDDAQDCCIQCGCGCNQDIDGLPHLLSPHLISQTADLPKVEALNIAEVYAFSAYFYISSVLLPPPNLS